MASTVQRFSNRLLSVLAGLSAFVLTLLGFLLLSGVDQQIAASLLIGVLALLVVRAAAERPNSAHARAVAALVDRLLAVGRGDLSSPAPAPLKREMPALAAAVEGLFDQVRSNLADVHALAMYDPVTTLPNRIFFRREAERVLASETLQRAAALLFIDLDGFKEVNDRLGHAAGDQVLVMVANRLRVVLKAEAVPGSMAPPLLARLAGDEFAMLLPHVGMAEEAERIASRAIAALAEPFTVSGQTVQIGASIGISLSPEHGTDLPALMKSADIAMYHAKSNGRSRLRTFQPALARVSEQRAELEASLRRAIQARELDLAFEPRLCLRTGAINGASATVRWRVGDGVRLLPPACSLRTAGMDFILGDWAIEAIGGAHARWRDQDLEHRLCFRVDSWQLERHDFLERLREALARSGPPPWNVEIELDEAAAATCDKWIHSALERMREDGVKIAVSDFGAGRAPLSAAASLPLDRVRLDPAIVAEVDRCERARDVAASLVHLVHALGCEAVAAGLIRHDQVEVLRALGCDIVQGFFGVEPMPEEAFLAWTQAQDCARSLARAS